MKSDRQEILFNAIAEKNNEKVLSSLQAGHIRPTTISLALLYAVAQDNSDIISTLVEQGADLQYIDNEGYTPLIMAAVNGYTQAIRGLLELGAPANQQNPDGDTALHYAASNQQYQATVLLLQHGADPNITNRKKRSPIFAVACHIQDDCSQDTETIIGGILLDPAAPRRPLFAWLSPEKAIINELVKAGADINYADQDGITPLVAAAAYGNDKVMKALLLFGADINRFTNNMGSVFEYSLLSGNTSALKLLTEYAPLPHPGSENEIELLFLAILKNYPEALDIILKDSDNLFCRNLNGETALHVAAREGNICMAERLLDAGIQVDATNLSEETPLFFAVSMNARCMVQMLLKRGANINAVNIHQQSPLHDAAAVGALETLEILITASADLFLKDHNGCTAKDIASAAGHSDAFRMLAAFMEAGSKPSTDHYKTSPA